ncbi:MAG: serine/threonine-protein phosphatase [Chloroflexota bacterium]|nr:serine/threonine-protein phosphatase [Chloroflexota bacterium]
MSRTPTTMFDIQIAVAKTNKYATRESGDTVEVVERPHGGFSIVLVDGQGSGKAAKNLSHWVTTKAVSMIKDGARDGVVARSAHDYLYTYRDGKVSATLVILSVDLASHTLVISRNSHCSVLLARTEEKSIAEVEGSSTPIGIYPMTKPSVTEMPLENGMLVVTYSDGLMEAGERTGDRINLISIIQEQMEGEKLTARSLADCLIAAALQRDANRPADDMAAVVMSIRVSEEVSPNTTMPQVRSMTVYIPGA